MNTASNQKLVESLRARLKAGISSIQLSKRRMTAAFARGSAQFWHKFYWGRYRLSNWKARYGFIAVYSAILLLISASIFFLPALQRTLEPHFSDQDRLSVLRNLFLALGGALIGATAIAFSLIMFAMQVNVERMPYGLFRRFSADTRLLGAFTGTTLLAICVASTSLIADRSSIAAAVLTSTWSIFLTFFLFLYAYRRALLLINPTKQLHLLVVAAERGLEAWVRRAKRAAPILEKPTTDKNGEDGPLRSTHDLTRTAYFRLNPHWTTGAQQAIRHAISFARRYSEQGDHEVSNAALSAVVAINRHYVEAKGKTFFGNNFLFPNPLSTDGFINDTLEHLRQNVRVGISRGDEEQIEQTLRAMVGLVQVYVQIDYSNPHVSKTHANIAAGYLSDAVKTVAPHNMADVMMEGERLMGQAAHLLLAGGAQQDVPALADEIGLVACLGAVNEKYRPVTLTGVEQLALLTFALIRAETHNAQFALEKLRQNIATVATVFLQKVPDTPLTSVHSMYLAPYYSLTTTSSLLSWLTELANAVSEAKSDDKNAKTVIRNIENWADGMYRTEKELLLLAIEKRSHFTFDIMHWIMHVTKLLLALSNAAACDDHVKDDLRKHALWLISTLSWVPGDKEAVGFIENYQMAEILFETAMDAHHRDCPEVFEIIFDLLLGWAFKGGRQETSCGILERALRGTATLAVMKDGTQSAEDVKRKLTAILSKPDAPDQQIRSRAAREIRQRASEFDREGFSLSRIELAMRDVDYARLDLLLGEIANILSPPTQTR